MENGFNKTKLAEVKKIIAVASGKGGVGKSTVSANLAYSLKAKGYKTAIYDADIYGPSLPILFGLQGFQPEIVDIGEQELIKPAMKDDIQIMSIGFFIDPSQPAIWRGPAASAYLKKFLIDTMWKDVDYLIIDLPPGTGDIVLTLCQELTLDGAVIVTTPQKLSLADVQKSVNMFLHHDIDVPVLGVIENMSWFTPEKHPDEKYFLFGQGGGKELADKFNTQLLAQLPLIEGLCKDSDSGKLKNHTVSPTIKNEFDNIVNTILPIINTEKKGKAMKICIPTENPDGMNTLAYGHFGSAPYFVIYDTDTKTIEVLKNNEAEHEHGQCNPVTPLIEKGVKAVVVAGMGARALQNLQSMGIVAYRIDNGSSITTILELLQAGKLEKLQIENSCQGHGCH